jgi:hypothetical protein
MMALFRQPDGFLQTIPEVDQMRAGEFAHRQLLNRAARQPSHC